MTKFIDGTIADVTITELKKYHDQRGWLAELFRKDELAPEFFPEMAYISVTLPGIARGPHEHVDQADYFCFLGPGNFKIYLWDNRPHSPTYNYRQIFIAGEEQPQAVIVPKGVVHAYQNVSNEPGMVINCANRLYKGEGRQAEIDEIRHEHEPDSPFKLD